MRKRLVKYAAAFLFLAMAAVMATPLVYAPPAMADDASYWNTFKALFVDWDDDAPPGSAKTEVTGVRGVDVEKKLKDKDYDWKAVDYMEDYKVSIDDTKKFLQEGQLGPFRPKGK